ncbi:hypothetical protein ACKF11_13225 [Methylobacillus sp. Pita2]|uniref:hypothetical protein n=1 Tax=Methylobacillus sp. Pita2 TaxID=3383245 RepID=UPI0038B5B4D0
MKHSENAAIRQHLSQFPEGMSYDEVLTAVEEDHDDVLIYGPYSNMESEDVTALIEAAQGVFEKLILDTGGTDSEITPAPSPRF